MKNTASAQLSLTHRGNAVFGGQNNKQPRRWESYGTTQVDSGLDERDSEKNERLELMLWSETGCKRLWNVRVVEANGVVHYED